MVDTSHHDYDFIPPNNGDWGCSYPPDHEDETYDLKVEVYKWMLTSKDPNIIDTRYNTLYEHIRCPTIGVDYQYL
eukprot:SAG11_NODE_6633_length_1276_cov_1.096856_2_plen_75_part_00